MQKDFYRKEWEKYIPEPVWEEHPEYEKFYKKTWEIARAHVKDIKGMPQTPYMDEAFCDTQVWIWDSCFMSLFCKYAQEVFPSVETLNNFYGVLYEGKQLPEVIPTETEPVWTDAVAGKPKRIDVHLADNPPLFAWAEYENALISGDVTHIKELLYEKKYLQKHYEWLENLKENVLLPGVLNMTHWKKEEKGYKWEGGCSGMDNTPRGRRGERAEKERPNDPDLLWIDAICQQALSAKAISKLFELAGDTDEAFAWQKKHAEKKELINKFYWDETDGFYYDIFCKDGEFCKVQTIASYWTLTAGVATENRAKRFAEYVSDPRKFGGDVPLVSLARDDADFHNLTGNYWRGSMWLPAAYAALKGLNEYGFYKEAQEAAEKIFMRMLATFEEYEPHTVWECYSPDLKRPATQTDDEEIVRSDFCGWSALGPISVYIEFVLGFHKVDAFENLVEWYKPNVKGKIGIKNLRFGEIVTDIIADEKNYIVTTNAPYSLKINGKTFNINKGKNEFVI